MLFSHQKFYSGQGDTKAVFKKDGNLQPLQVKRLKASGNTLDILFNDRNAQATAPNKNGFNFYPYKSERLNHETVIFQATPSSGQAVLPKGFNMKNITWWDQDYSGDDGDTYYRLVHGGWVNIDD